MRKEIRVLCALLLATGLVACTGTAGSTTSGEGGEWEAASGNLVEETSFVEPLHETSPEEDVPELDENTLLLELEHLTISVTTTPELEVTDIEFTSNMRLSFGYSKGELQGETTMIPGMARYIDWMREITALALRFECREGTAYLLVDWAIDPVRLAKDIGEGQDVYMLDEEIGLWVQLRDDVLLHPLDLEKEDAARLFPEEELTEYSFVALNCYETLYDLRVFWVWDFYLGPENGDHAVLLAEYEVYEPVDVYLWQSDIMYKKHLAIEYMDAEGQLYRQGYSIMDGKGVGSSHWLMSEEAWAEDMQYLE